MDEGLTWRRRGTEDWKKEELAKGGESGWIKREGKVKGARRM